MKKLGACQFKNRINMKGRDHHWLTRDHILFRVSFCFCGEDDGIKNKRATFFSVNNSTYLLSYGYYSLQSAETWILNMVASIREEHCSITSVDNHL